MPRLLLSKSSSIHLLSIIPSIQITDTDNQQRQAREAIYADPKTNLPLLRNRSKNLKQDQQCTYNVKLRGFRATPLLQWKNNVYYIF